MKENEITMPHDRLTFKVAHDKRGYSIGLSNNGYQWDHTQKLSKKEILSLAEFVLRNIHVLGEPF
jgi:hypothetical protein